MALLFLVWTLMLTPSVSADGIWYTSGQMEYWHLLNERAQMGAIYYIDGTEELYLSVWLDNYSQSLFWIFPVPSDPGLVNVSISKEFPSFGGVSYGSYVKRKIKDEMAALAMTNSYVLPFYMGPAGRPSTTEVYKVFHGRGIRLEVISAGDIRSLEKYLSSLNFVLPEELETQLEYYLKGNYSLVLYYVTNMTEAKEAYGDLFAVKVVFPTEKIYFPLKLTSVYGAVEIPVVVFIEGFVQPELYEGLKDKAKVDYMVQYTYEWGNPRITRKYTRIEITAQALHFREDLWIKPEEPAGIRLIEVLDRASKPISVLLFLIIPVMLSLLLGRIIFGKWDMNFAMLGTFSYLGVTSFMLAVLYTLIFRKKIENWIGGFLAVVMGLLLMTGYLNVLIPVALFSLIAPLVGIVNLILNRRAGLFSLTFFILHFGLVLCFAL
ncbi:hypothetical protein JCM16138_07390 [Thermococcus atlanticus]